MTSSHLICCLSSLGRVVELAFAPALWPPRWLVAVAGVIIVSVQCIVDFWLLLCQDAIVMVVPEASVLARWR